MKRTKDGVNQFLWDAPRILPLRHVRAKLNALHYHILWPVNKKFSVLPFPYKPDTESPLEE